MAFLEIRDLTYTYPNSGIRAVDGLSMVADRGEIIAVIGPNAAGKSTFALLLKGMLRADSGTVTIGDKERNIHEPDPHIGILFSNPENQLVTSIVEEDVAFGLEVLGEGSPEIERKVEAVLHRLGIAHLGKRMPHLMSGGEQQMAALAGVLVLDPDIVVLDEPTTYLDPDAKGAVLASMRELADQGKIILLITHDMKEAASADRVLFLDEGRIALEGAPDELFSHTDLAERYGISPPFLLDLVLGMRSMGMDIPWPVDTRSLAGEIVNTLLAGGRSGLEEEGPSRKAHRGEPALTFDGIRFGYGPDSRGREPVLRGVDFSVGKGTIALVCGANGSGKSTLLQMSNGLVMPDEGRVLVSGEHLKDWKKRRGSIPRRVALLFQNPGRQVFSATVYDDIAFGPRNMGVSADKIEERVLRAARWAGLPDTILDRPVFTLSGGQMRRTAVAGVLAMEAEVLVLDEPTDGLDPGGAREFFTSARRYCDETGTAIVMATHEVPELIRYMDHFGHLADGRILSSGPPSEVLTGSARTLPRQFLPDHMILREELLERGHSLPDGMIDPGSILERLLALVSGAV